MKQHCNDALRLINQSLRNKHNDFEAWERTSCSFPYLVNHPTLLKFYDLVEDIIGYQGKRSGIQIIYHLPDNDDCNRELFGTHVDGMLPADATQPHYTTIAAIAFNDWDKNNGSLWVPDGDSKNYITVPANHFFSMNGTQYHGLGNNTTAMPRIGVYLRWYL